MEIIFYLLISEFIEENGNGVVTRDVEILIFHPDYNILSESILQENNLILFEMEVAVRWVTNTCDVKSFLMWYFFFTLTEYMKPIKETYKGEPKKRGKL